jgi:hypothetical protein
MRVKERQRRKKKRGNERRWKNKEEEVSELRWCSVYRK